MKNIRLVPRLDIKGPNLIKGVHLEGLRVVGDPQVYAQKYYAAGADELIYMDVVASLYGRNNLADLISNTVKNVFVPITVGGGIRSVDDVHRLLRSGADKVAINTAAVARPNLIREVSTRFGAQCMVLSVEAIADGKGGWEAYTDNGREKTGLQVVDWVRQAVDLGAGEILLTSVDHEGTRKGFAVELLQTVAEQVPVPVIASGGMGSVDDLVTVVQQAHVDAIAMADILHYERMDLRDIRQQAGERGIKVRQLQDAA